MSLHPLDRSIRSRIANGSATVPAGMWESIETQLPAAPVKKRPVMWFWVLGLTLITSAAILASQYFSNDSSQESAAVIADQNDPEPDNLQSTAVAITDNIDSNDESGSSVSVRTLGTDHKPEVKINTGEAVSDSDQRELKTPSNTRERGNERESVADALTPTTITNSTSGNNPKEVASVTVSPLRAQAATSFIQGGRGQLKTPFSSEGAVTDCYAFGKTSSGRWLAEVYTGPTYSLKSMESRDEDVSGFISGRDSTESAQISWHAGVRIGYEHSSGLTAKVGFQYSLVNELFQQVSRTSGILIDTTFDSSGNIISIDTSVVTGELTKQTQNRYHAIDIPLILGYRIDNGNWDFGIEAGPVFNITYQSKGDMIGADGQPFSFSEESDPTYQPVFNTNVGIGLYAGVYASMRVGESIWVFAEPNILHRFGSITRDDFPIDQRQTNISLSLGIRYKF